jgi:creatinine amidohydrolase
MTQWIHEMKWPEVAEYLKTNDTVLIPVGSVEQHGTHLPMMTDAAEATDVAEMAAQRTGVLITPPLWFGWSPHHLAFPGTISLSSETLIRVVEDIAYSLLHHGFKKLIYINGHRVSNLPPLELAQVRIRNRTNCYMVVVDIQLIARKEIGEICDGVVGTIGHACEVETSHMLFTHPELVDMSKAVRQEKNFDSKYLGSFSPTDPYIDRDMVGLKSTIDEYRKAMSPAGTGGDPFRASREKGQKIIEAIVANTVEIIERAKKTNVVLKPIEPPL